MSGQRRSSIPTRCCARRCMSYSVGSCSRSNHQCMLLDPQLEEGRGCRLSLVYNRLMGIEPQTSAELVRYRAQALAPIIDSLEGSRAPGLTGYRIKILDDNCE